MKKIKFERNKVIISISIALTSFVFGLVMVTQFKTIEETDVTGIELMKEAELRTELASWKSKYEDVENQIEDVDSKIEEYSNEINNNNNVSSLIQQELEEKKVYSGYTDVEGNGIIITLKDTATSQITESDLIDLVNELKLAGAEAISINDNRITATTDISNISYKYLYINTGNGDKLNRISSPYVIKAIGNTKYLESAITIKYGFVDTMDSEGKNVDYTIEENVIINKYDGDMDYTYAHKVD